jgi:hypothetical protein
MSSGTANVLPRRDIEGVACQDISYRATGKPQRPEIAPPSTSAGTGSGTSSKCCSATGSESVAAIVRKFHTGAVNGDADVRPRARPLPLWLCG